MEATPQYQSMNAPHRNENSMVVEKNLTCRWREDCFAGRQLPILFRQLPIVLLAATPICWPATVSLRDQFSFLVRVAHKFVWSVKQCVNFQYVA